MRRLLIVVPIALAFAAGWTLATERSHTAEARPRTTCKDDLARTRRELTASRAESETARAESAQARAEVERLLERERARVRKLEEQIGAMMQELK